MKTCAHCGRPCLSGQWSAGPDGSPLCLNRAPFCYRLVTQFNHPPRRDCYACAPYVMAGSIDEQVTP